MRFPSKVTPYKDSILPRMTAVAKLLKVKDYTVLSLFNEVREKMTIKEYIDSLDCLFALKKIIMKEDVLHYVERNIL